MKNPNDRLFERMYTRIRNSILDAAKRGEEPDILVAEYLDRIKLSYEPRVFNRLKRDSNPTVAAFGKVMTDEFLAVLNHLLEQFT